MIGSGPTRDHVRVAGLVGLIADLTLLKHVLQLAKRLGRERLSASPILALAEPATVMMMIMMMMMFLQPIPCSASPLYKEWLDLSAGDGLMSFFRPFIDFLSQPYVFYPLLAWAITFTIVLLLLLTLGFGGTGIVAGSLAAAFQSWMYRGFTPAAGLFATLTSVAMAGYAMPVFAALAAVLATGVALLVWYLEVGGSGQV